MLRSFEARISRLEALPELKNVTFLIAEPGETREQTFERYGNPEDDFVYLNFYGRCEDEKQD